jgi:hypothetical protein
VKSRRRHVIFDFRERHSRHDHSQATDAGA